MCNEFLKYGGDELRRTLLRVFKGFVREGRTPGEWNSERVKLLHKEGNKQELDNYRRTSISSVVGKLFDKLLTTGLTEITENRGWLPEEQVAFREKRGTMDHLFVLNWIMERS